jgi:3-oxoacyl-[acyl-carrier protein] reductase
MSEVRRALVTGAAGEIGGAIVEELLAAGLAVVPAASSATSATKLRDRFGDRLEPPLILDLARPLEDAALREIEERAVDVLVNNAGVTADGLMLRLKPDDWRRVFEVNFFGAMSLIRAVLRGMVARRFGRVVSISSVVAASGNPGQANYAGSKGALEAATRSLALEYASRNVTFNCVAPGLVRSALTAKLSSGQVDAMLARTPSGRPVSAAQVARAVRFLVECDDVTGQVLHVNGGAHL